MIKKLAVFVLLLVGGFSALYYVTNGGAVTDKTSGTEEQLPSTGPSGPGIHSRTDERNSGVTVDFGGKWNFSENRPVKLPGGGIKHLPLYRLDARDSHTEPRNKLVLDDVTVRIFEIVERPQPSAKQVAVMRAERARVEFSQGSDGAIRPAKDKLMEFWSLVCEAQETKKSPGLTLEMEQARFLNTENHLRLWTPEETQKVTVIGAGDEPFRVDGQGLKAWIPTVRDEEGDLELAPRGAREIYVLNDPVLTYGTTTLQSVGALHIREDVATGAARVTMKDQVRMIATRKAKAKSNAKPDAPIEIHARGDQLTAHLVRTTVGKKSTGSWTRVHLSGSPVHLDQGDQAELTAGALTVFPGLDDEPVWFVAHRGNGMAPKMKFVQDGVAHEFETNGPVHVVRIRHQHGNMLASYGIPFGAIPSEFDQVVLFETDSTVRAPLDGLTIGADGGLVVLRSERKALRDRFVIRGRGNIDVRSTPVASAALPPRTPLGKPAEAAARKRTKTRHSDLHLIGNRGFTLKQRRRSTDSGTEIVRHLQLGPAHIDGSHRYEVRYTGVAKKATKSQPKPDAPTKIFVKGTGTCAIRMHERGIEQLALTSTTDDIEVAMNGTDNQARQLGSVLAWFHDDGALERFVGKGTECKISFLTPEGRVDGDAREIHQVEANAYRLHGSPAELVDPKRGRLRGQKILIRRLTRKDLQLQANGNAYLHWTHRVEGKSATTTTGNLYADEIRIEPFLAAPMVATFLDGRVGAAPGLVERYLFATGTVRFDYASRRAGAASGSQGASQGDRLVLRTDATGRAFTDGFLVGDPAVLDSIDARGRHSIARSDRIDFFLRRSEQHLHLHHTAQRPPEIEILGDLQQPVRSSSPDQQKTVFTCTGPIDIAPQQIRCLGKVRARSFDTQGNPDLAGLHLDTDRLTIDRLPDGTVRRAKAAGNIDFRWSGARGTCDHLTLDLENQALTARGDAKPAAIQLPSGLFKVQQVNYNYRTKMVRCWRGSFDRALTQK